jgi:hypothetical protein
MRKLIYTLVLVSFQFLAISGQELSTLERVKSLNTPVLKKELTVFYSPGFESRAEEVAPLIEDARDFYRKKLGFNVDLSVALLDRAQWEKMTRVPYGLPFFSEPPHVAFLPATHDGVVAADTLALRNAATPKMLSRLRSAGYTFDQAAAKTVDLIGLHELGHTYAFQLGIRDGRPNKWLNEFLASYFAYAYLRERKPRLATVFQVMTAETSAVAPPQKHTSLSDFEKYYVGVGPSNYGWYQGRFFARVAEVYDAKKLAFIKEVGVAFPASGSAVLPIDTVLDRLEKIAPGFKAWAATME